MTIRAHNIVRTFWRSIEILIFFGISVVGFNILFRTTSFNAKTKDRSFSGGHALGAGLAGHYRSLPLHDGSPNTKALAPLSSEKKVLRATRNTTDAARFHLLSVIEKHLAKADPGLSKERSLFLSPLDQPHNLIQQNRTLLI